MVKIKVYCILIRLVGKYRDVLEVLGGSVGFIKGMKFRNEFNNFKSRSKRGGYEIDTT